MLYIVVMQLQLVSTNGSCYIFHTSCLENLSMVTGHTFLFFAGKYVKNKIDRLIQLNHNNQNVGTPVFMKHYTCNGMAWVAVYKSKFV